MSDFFQTIKPQQKPELMQPYWEIRERKAAFVGVQLEQPCCFKRDVISRQMQPPKDAVPEMRYGEMHAFCGAAVKWFPSETMPDCSSSSTNH